VCGAEQHPESKGGKEGPNGREEEGGCHLVEAEISLIKRREHAKGCVVIVAYIVVAPHQARILACEVERRG